MTRFARPRGPNGAHVGAITATSGRAMSRYDQTQCCCWLLLRSQPVNSSKLWPVVSHRRMQMYVVRPSPPQNSTTSTPQWRGVRSRMANASAKSAARIVLGFGPGHVVISEPRGPHRRKQRTNSCSSKHGSCTSKSQLSLLLSESKVKLLNC